MMNLADQPVQKIELCSGGVWATTGIILADVQVREAEKKVFTLNMFNEFLLQY
jgi:hypothetical protein